jgi:hypothetical protein
MACFANLPTDIVPARIYCNASWTIEHWLRIHGLFFGGV